MESWQFYLLIGAIVALVFLFLGRIFRFLQQHWRSCLIVFTVLLSVFAYLVNGVNLGLDLKGGSELLYRIRYEDIPPAQRKGIVNRTIDIIERRLNPKGTKELRIQEHGPYRILIQLPGATAEETERIKNLIEKAGKLEFRMVNSDEADRDLAKQGRTVAGCTPYVREPGRSTYRRARFSELPDFKGDWLLVMNRVELTGSDLKRAYPTFDRLGAPAVGFEFKRAAARKFARLTERNIGKQLAIILDDILYSHPVIKTRILGPGIIEGNFTQDEVNDLVITLQAGSLPADLELEMENSVGPTLGEDSIRKGIAAAIIGLILVMGFMGGYYLFAGAVADLALIMDLILVVGALSILDATLTLPGIAGLVLTVGMAVDANVLIYERIREERREGKAIRLAIKNGYERAFTTIIDANLTTLITALILYAVGTGPVKGFAVTLSLGIIMSLYTALFVTRSIFEWMLLHGHLTEFKMHRLIGVPNIRFSQARRTAMGISFVLIVVGVAFFASRGKKKYDIDFTGGTLLQLELRNPISIDEARAKVREAGYPEAEVQSIWHGGRGSLVGKTTKFGIRIPAGAFEEERIKDIIQSDVIEACGGKEAVEKISSEGPLAVSVVLKKKLSEEKLREELAKLDYRGSTIKSIEGEEVKAKRYSLTLSPGLSPEERGAALRKIEEVLRGLVETKKIECTFGTVGEAPVEEKGGGKVRFQIDVDLTEALAVQIIEDKLSELVGEKLELRGRGTQSGRDVCDRLIALGSNAALKKLEEMGSHVIEVTAISYAEKEGAARCEFELKQPMTEGELRKKLKDSAASILSIVPLGIESKSFKIVFTDLPEIKREQKIRKDLMAKFRGNLLMEKIDVKFEPYLPPKEEEEEGKEYKYFKLKIAKPISPDLLKAKFIKAGCSEKLVLHPDEAAKDKITEAVIKVKPEEADEVKKAITAAFEVPDPFSRVVSIGATVAGEMKNRAFLALFFALGAIIFYITFRFGELKFGIAAVIALAHDVLITMGAIAFADWLGETGYGAPLMISEIKINLPMVAAFLTIIGYSLNDTIVVFDRIRENIAGRGRRVVTPEIIDRSINQTLARTLLTSLTTLIVVVVLYVVGGGVIHGFAFALIVGVIVGTYSSIFIASPVLLEWDRLFGKGKRSGRA